MKINQTDLITVPRSRKPGHYQFIGGSDARIIISLDEAALIRLWTGDPSRARAAKSPTAQGLCSCDPFGASPRELATNDGRPLQNYRPS
jgi:hypothetical protein